MRKLKKSLSIILAALMIMSVMAVSAGASSYELTKIEGMYETAAPMYSETFDTEEAATAFATGAKFDEANQRMKLERAADGDATEYGKAFNKAPTKIEDGTRNYVEFDVWAESNIGRVEIRLNRGSQIVTRLYLFTDGTFSALINGGRYDANVTAKANDKNTIRILADCNTDKSYVWLNNELCEWDVNGTPCDEIPFANSQTYWDRIYFYFPEIENASGSVYVDNFKITPLEEKSLNVPVSNGTYLCNETFEAYEEGALVEVTDGAISDIIATDLVGENGILNTTMSGTGGSAPHMLEICKEADGNKVLKSPEEGWTFVHNLFYSKASGYGQGANNYLVVQVKLKAISEDNGAYFYADLGTGSENGHQVKVYIYQNQVLVDGKNVSGTDYIDGQWHTITYLLDKNAGETGRLSLWIDDTLLGNSEIGYQFDCPNSIKAGWPVALYLRNKSGEQMDLYIDDLIAFDGESFMNVKNMDAELTEIADFSEMGTDDAPTDFSADVLKAAASVISETATATFTDSKGYFNGTNIVFPLYEDTTDVLVEISDGNVKTMKEFTNVPIKPAYSNIVKNVSQETPTAIASFNAGTITAARRNSASDISGRLTIYAAIYDKTTGQLLKVQKQTDTLGDDGQFECVLDLSNLENDALANTELKLFIFENGTLVPLA